MNWLGSKPEKCDLCNKPFEGVFIDGRTTHGPWGMMCPRCHSIHGTSLGTGNGQRYKLQPDGLTWEKTQG